MWFVILTTKYEITFEVIEVTEVTVWKGSEKFMSVTFNILKKTSVAKLYSDIRRYFVKQRELGSDIRRYIVKQRELGLFRLIAESRIL